MKQFKSSSPLRTSPLPYIWMAEVFACIDFPRLPLLEESCVPTTMQSISCCLLMCLCQQCHIYMHICTCRCKSFTASSLSESCYVALLKHHTVITDTWLITVLLIVEWLLEAEVKSMQGFFHTHF